MQNTTGPIGTAVFLVAWTLAMVHVGIGKYVIERLKDRHRAIWIELERPGLFVNGTKRNAFLLWRFITFGRHRALQDQTLSSICRWDTMLQIVTAPLFVVAVYLLAKNR